MNTWTILAPIAMGVSVVLISLAVLSDWRKSKRARYAAPAPDERNWNAVFMKDVKENPRSWR